MAVQFGPRSAWRGPRAARRAAGLTRTRAGLRRARLGAPRHPPLQLRREPAGYPSPQPTWWPARGPPSKVACLDQPAAVPHHREPGRPSSCCQLNRAAPTGRTGPTSVRQRPGSGPGGDPRRRLAPDHQPGRRADSTHRPVDGDQAPRASSVTSACGRGVKNDTGRPHPDPPGPRRAPQPGGAPSFLRTVRAHLFGGRFAAPRDRPQDRLVPEHGLHPHGGPRDPVTDHGLTPERELVPGAWTT